jgi:hypothetical protein
MLNIAELKDKVLNSIRMNGPSIPLQAARVLGTDTYFSGAILSELVADKKLRISRAKIGGSPVYYLPEQEDKLNILYNSLPQREKEAYDLLKNKKLILARLAEPAIRVALQSIIDFSIPINVNVGKGEEQAFAWYLVKEDEIKSILDNLKEKTLEIKKEEPKIIQDKIQEQRILQPQEARTKDVKTRINKADKGKFVFSVTKFLEDNKIKIIENELGNKNKEFNCVVSVPSNIGEMQMIVVAKDKNNNIIKTLTVPYQFKKPQQWLDLEAKSVIKGFFDEQGSIKYY